MAYIICGIYGKYRVYMADAIYLWFHFQPFQFSSVNHSPFISFELCATLNMVKTSQSCPVSQLHKRSLCSSIHSVYATCMLIS